MKESFFKHICPVSKKETYYYRSEYFTTTIELLYSKETKELWSAKIEAMQNLTPEYTGNPLTGKWPVNNDGGSSNKEEFKKAYHTAINFLSKAL